MNEVKIVTNNQPRDILDWWDLTDEEREEFDYLDTQEAQDFAQFMRYKGEVYDLHEFQMTRPLPEDSPFRPWQGVQADSYFSGILIRFSEDDGVIAAWFHC